MFLPWHDTFVERAQERLRTKHGHFHCVLPQLVDLDQHDKIRSHCLRVCGERFGTPSLCSSTLHAQSIGTTRFFLFILHGIGMFMFLCWNWFQEFSAMEILEEEKSMTL
ncbi:hypothetical protein, partial [Enterobacter cloacae complex sp. 4DZ3-17B2]|uniref:hypothetical protein n=1 Tax=Enterobacter cloacae complex sp. 4DZ3-17B2 TaxID=2511990 RepID=UPI001CA4B0C4